MRSRIHLWLILSLGFAASACDRSRTDKSSATEERTNTGDYVIAKLEKIVIPVINFQDASIEEAIDFLRMRSYDCDTYEPEKRGISLIINNRRSDASDGGADDLKLATPNQVSKINYRAKNVGLLTAMKEIARQAHMDVYLTNVGIVICGPGESPLPVGKLDQEEVWKTIHKEVISNANKTEGGKPQTE